MNNDIIFYATPETRRDRYGRYLVVRPKGGKPTGYTRATTVAKALDDTSSLMAWAERMTAIGLSQRPDLLAEVALAGDDKQKLNAICGKAKEHGGATVRRDLGTSLHKVLEESFTIADYVAPVQFAADVQAVHNALSQHRLLVVAGMTERIVVLDEWGIAGTFDLLLMNEAGDLFVADIKTGSNVTYGALAFCVQLALYAHADSIYQQGPAADGSQDVREPMPNVNKHTGIIIHVEPGSGVCTIHELQLHWELVELAIEVRAARTMRNLIKPWQNAMDRLLEERNQWIRERIANCTEINKKLLAAHWPPSILPPKKAQKYTAAEVEDLDVVLGRVERELDITWPTLDPRITDVQKNAVNTTNAHDNIIQEAPQGPEMPDEGEQQPDTAKTLKTAYSALSDEQNARMRRIVAEARDAQLPIRVAETPTARRCHIAHALLRLISANIDDNHIRGLLASIVGDIAEIPSVTLGSVVGLLNWQQAQTFAGLAQLVDINQ
jgi:hypothetical protein